MTSHYSRTCATHPYLYAQTHTHTHISSPSGLTVSLIYEVPLIWPKHSLRDLPPLSSLHLCIPPSLPPSHQSLSRVNQRGGIAQQAIHRLDTLTNIPLSSLSPSLAVYLTLPVSPFFHLSCRLSKSNLALFLSFVPLLDLPLFLFCRHFCHLPCACFLCSFPLFLSFSPTHCHHTSSLLSPTFFLYPLLFFFTPLPCLALLLLASSPLLFSC